MASIADLRSPASDAAADAILALINAGLWTPTRTGENGKPRRDAGNDNIRVTAVYPYQPMLGAALSTFGIGGGSISLAFPLRIDITMRAIS